MFRYTRYLVLTIVLVAVGTCSFAQQVAQYTLNSFNKYSVNPAIVGTEDFIDFKASYRTQWANLNGGGAPKTGYFSFHMPVAYGHGTSHHHRKNERSSWFGVGSFIMSDAAGPTNIFAGYATGSYNMQLNKEYRVSFGTSVGLKNYSFDGREIRNLTDGIDGDVLFNQGFNQITPDLQAGIWVYSDWLYVGVSSQQLLGTRLSQLDFPNQQSGGSLGQHYFLQTGVYVPLSRELSLYPSALLKVISPAPPSLDLGVRATYNGKYWVAGFMRSSDSFSLAVGTLIDDQISVTYGYDLNYSDLSPFNSGSHEIIIGYRLPPKHHVDCPSRFWN